jgi:hypothetical protein
MEFLFAKQFVLGEDRSSEPRQFDSKQEAKADAIRNLVVEASLALVQC